MVRRSKQKKHTLITLSLVKIVLTLKMTSVENYSDKAIAVFGTITPAIEQILTSLGGKFNPSLKGLEDSRRPGWIFPKSKKEQVEKALRTEVVTTPPTTSSSTTSSTSTTSAVSTSTLGGVTLKAFQTLERLVHSLSSRVEVIETEQRKRPCPPTSVTTRYDDEEEPSPEEEPVENNKVTKSFMSGKK